MINLGQITIFPHLNFFWFVANYVEMVSAIFPLYLSTQIATSRLISTPADRPKSYLSTQPKRFLSFAWPDSCNETPFGGADKAKLKQIKVTANDNVFSSWRSCLSAGRVACHVGLLLHQGVWTSTAHFAERWDETERTWNIPAGKKMVALSFFLFLSSATDGDFLSFTCAHRHVQSQTPIVRKL